jgi:hypothetical protein
MTLAYNHPLYQKNRVIIRATATRCARCGQPFRPGEPIDVDHIDTIADRRARGLAPDHRLANLRAVHAIANRGGHCPRPRPTRRADIHPDD